MMFASSTVEYRTLPLNPSGITACFGGIRKSNFILRDPYCGRVENGA